MAKPLEESGLMVPGSVDAVKKEQEQEDGGAIQALIRSMAPERAAMRSRTDSMFAS